MNTSLRLFINLLLSISMALAPVSATLSATDPIQQAHVTGTGDCNHAGHAPSTADDHQNTTGETPCSCCIDDCSCSADVGCHHRPVSHFVLMTASSAAGIALAEETFPAPLVGSFVDVLTAPPTHPPQA